MKLGACLIEAGRFGVEDDAAAGIGSSVEFAVDGNAKAIYKERVATVECVNVQAHNPGKLKPPPLSLPAQDRSSVASSQWTFAASDPKSRRHAVSWAWSAYE